MCDKKEKQLELDKRYLRMAAVWAENSYCKRRQVGALIVRDQMIISDGYNGTPSGFENVCEDENNVTKPYVLHAEANAITKVAASSNSSKDATIYVTSLLASNVPNSSSNLGSSGWYTLKNTGWKICLLYTSPSPRD